MSNENNVVRVYACGGTGASIALSLEQLENTQSIASRDIVIVDTSMSNLIGGSNTILPTYILPDVDGSGKDRTANAKSIEKHAPNIINTYPPSKINVVISSGGGGSGSVIAPCIVKELLKNNENVIVIVTGNMESEKVAINTLRTLQSYVSVSKNNCLPIAYIPNGDYKETNQKVAFIISGIQTLCSNKNYGIDSMDISNFINWTKVTQWNPGAALFTIHRGEIGSADNENSIISVISISCEHKTHNYPFVPSYSNDGQYPKEVAQQKVQDTHFVLSATAFVKLYNSIKNEVEALEHKGNSARRVISEEIVLDVDDGGLVF